MAQIPVVLLIHGIRTAASWQARIAALIQGETGATVIPIKYGYFDVLRFLCPFGVCRKGPIERLRQQIEGVGKQYPDRPLIVFAHSYGTYALTRVIDQNPYFRFDRVILCGSVVPFDYDWRKVEEQIKGAEKRNAIINECGTRDIWPVLAQSVTWGYGATGTYGFGTFNVRDRFHDLAHSDFFTDAFAQKYWIPLVRGDTVVFSEQDAAGVGAPGWFNLFRLPLKFAVPAAFVAVVVTLALPVMSALAGCGTGQQKVGGECHTTTHLATVDELQAKARDLANQVENTLDLKSGFLFPDMDRYVTAPLPERSERWNEIKQTTVELLGFIDAGLKQLTDDKALFVSNEKGTFYVTGNAVIPVEPTFPQAFEDIKKHFRGRAAIIDEMQSASEPPTPEQMAKWKSELEDLHRKLEQSLRKLGELLVVTA